MKALNPDANNPAKSKTKAKGGKAKANAKGSSAKAPAQAGKPSGKKVPSGKVLAAGGTKGHDELERDSLLDDVTIEEYFLSHADKHPPEHILNDFDKDPRAMKVRYVILPPPHSLLSFSRLSSVCSSFSATFSSGI